MFLTNSSKYFEDSLTLETDLSDSHKHIVIVIKTKHECFPPKVVKYRDYKNFDVEVFKNRLQLTLQNSTSFEQFKDLSNKIAPL